MTIIIKLSTVNNILLQTNTNEKVAIYYIKIALIKKNKTKYHYVLTNYSPIRIIFIFKLKDYEKNFS